MVASSVDFGKLEPSAQFLIERALATAQGVGQEFDTLHLLLVVLTEPASAGSAAQSVSTHLTEEQTIGCVGAVRVQLQLHARVATAPGAVTANVQKCLELWTAEAQRRSLRVTETLILWAIISGDDVIGQILRTFAIDLGALTRDLERRFEITSKLPPLRSGHTVLDAAVRNHVEIVSPSVGCHFANAHAVLMANMLNVLGALDQSQICVVAGYNGTPLFYIEQVLADILALGTTFSDERPRLQHDYQGVYRLNLAGLRSVVADPTRPKPALVLQTMLEIAVQERAILVIHGLELLQQHTAEDQELLAMLANPNDALIIGLYELPMMGGREPTEALELSNVVSVTAHPYSAKQSLALLRTYYLPHWVERYRISFSDDAFDHVIALEPGAWINVRRKTLPYLAVGLASDVIQTILGGESLVHETLIMAIDALDKLHDEWATTELRIRNQFEPTLEQVYQEIMALLPSPMPQPDANETMMLTRAHVTAQLICPNDSEFHYPGHAPEQLSVRRQDDLPAHLYTLFTRYAEG